MKALLVRTLEEWRDWLAEHHSSESEVRLIFYRRQTGAVSVAYKDARDEALCTPRRADSRWSAVNRKRHAELKPQGD